MQKRFWARGKGRGIILMTALLIVGIMMAWAVAATYRANFQTGATRFSYQKSEGYYLARTGMSRSLAQVNGDPSWLVTHSGRANADTTTTPDTRCWAETVPGKPNNLLLRCEATVGNHMETLTVPISKKIESDTHFYSIAPSTNGGPDTIVWSTVNTDTWEALPPIPGVQSIISTTPTPNGDLYAVSKNNGVTSVWRYRDGQGWFHMPDPPTGVAISDLSAGGDNYLVSIGSDNGLLSLSLASSSTAPVMKWDDVPAPNGLKLTNAAANPLGNGYSVVTGTDAAGNPSVYQYNAATKSWTGFPAPTAVTFDSTSGAQTGSGGTPPNYSGGVAVDKSGNIYVGSNPVGSPSVVYAFQPTTPGSNLGSWTPLAAIEGLDWGGSSMNQVVQNGYATNIKHLKADDQAHLWAEWFNPATQRSSVVLFGTTNR